PGDDRDIRARVAALGVRAAAHASRPHVDAHGMLHYQSHVVALTLLQSSIARSLSAHLGDVVTDGDIRTALGMSDESPAEGSLRVEMSRLRVLLRPLGLTIRRVRGRGYRLETG